jgi:hypothetical protein
MVKVCLPRCYREAVLDALSPLGSIGSGIADGKGAIYLWARLPGGAAASARARHAMGRLAGRHPASRRSARQLRRTRQALSPLATLLLMRGAFPERRLRGRRGGGGMAGAGAQGDPQLLPASYHLPH